MNPIEDKLLDEYFAGDSPFSRRYRETPAHDVPPELDAKILAASKAPTRRSALSRWRVWSAPLALAATVVIAVAVILRGGIEHAAVQSQDMQERSAVEVTTNQEMIVPAAPPAAAAPAAAAPEPVPEATRSEAKSKAIAPAKAPRARERDTQMFKKEVTRDEALPVAPASAASDQLANAPAPTVTSNTSQKPQAPLEQDVVVTGAFRRSEPAAGAGPHNSVRPAEKSERTLEKEAREADPDLWLEYIRDLRKNNDIRAADREWNKFVNAYPNYAVAADDLARPK
jgi:hypothetical protein